MYINNWNEVPDGAKVIEDTYPEVYEIFTKNGKRYLRVVGSQVPSSRVKSIIGEEMEIDFELSANGEQPWIRID